MRKEIRTIASLVVLTALPVLARAEVARVDISSRREVLAGRAFGATGTYTYFDGVFGRTVMNGAIIVQ